MRRLALCLIIALLYGCSFTTIADPYGNEYGGWYSPGGSFSWQLGVCEKQMDSDNVPPIKRKAAMRCCMHDHGVPVDNIAGCAA